MITSINEQHPGNLFVERWKTLHETGTCSRIEIKELGAKKD